ncbi:hypothetical protein C8J56DRAFT_248503 [Mycena floridula]|nr:hypothetical protein C8J56DRAFT_248503 [Mycena floridula]
MSSGTLVLVLVSRLVPLGSAIAKQLEGRVHGFWQQARNSGSNIQLWPFESLLEAHEAVLGSTCSESILVLINLIGLDVSLVLPDKGVNCSS